MFIISDLGSLHYKHKRGTNDFCFRNVDYQYNHNLLHQRDSGYYVVQNAVQPLPGGHTKLQIQDGQLFLPPWADNFHDQKALLASQEEARQRCVWLHSNNVTSERCWQGSHSWWWSDQHFLFNCWIRSEAREKFLEVLLQLLPTFRALHRCIVGEKFSEHFYAQSHLDHHSTRPDVRQ